MRRCFIGNRNTYTGDDMFVQFEVPKTEKKIIAIDFDGTIIKNKYPIIENPDMEVIAFIKRHRRKYIWILWTCRTGERLREAVEYMRDTHGITFDYVNENAVKWGEDSRKVWADYYLDDRNVFNLLDIRRSR